MLEASHPLGTDAVRVKAGSQTTTNDSAMDGTRNRDGHCPEAQESRV
jgi:hypothetical protein